MRASTKGKRLEEMGTGMDLPAPGRYHVAVMDVDESFEKSKSSIVISLQVLAGSVPGQEGKQFNHFFYYPTPAPDWCVDRITRFLWAAGVIGENEERDVDLKNEATGKHFCVELAKQTGKDGKERIQIIDGGFWPLNHPHVRDIPKNQAAMQMVGAGAPAPAAAPQQQQQAQATASAPAQSPGVNDPYDGL